MSDTLISIEDVISENSDVIESVKEEVRQGLRRFARELPTGFHEEMRQGLLDTLLRANGLNQSTVRVKLAIDANFIIAEAFRVGRGKTSTTERVLRSPYVEVFAHRVIWEEVERNIRKDLPKDASLDRAFAHAKLLLSLVKKMDDASSWAINRARAAIAAHSPEDVPLLAVAIENDADAVISQDRMAFGAQNEVKRWNFGQGVEVITSYEAGSLSLAITGTATEMISDALQKVAIWLASAIEEVLEIVDSLLGALVTGIADALSKIPVWAWGIIIGVGIGALIVATCSKEFRDWAVDGFTKVGEALKPIVAAFVESAKRVWSAVRVILVVAWNVVIFITPFVLAAAGVVLEHVKRLFEMVEAKGVRGITQE